MVDTGQVKKARINQLRTRDIAAAAQVKSMAGPTEAEHTFAASAGLEAVDLGPSATPPAGNIAVGTSDVPGPATTRLSPAAAAAPPVPVLRNDIATQPPPVPLLLEDNTTLSPHEPLGFPASLSREPSRLSNCAPATGVARYGTAQSGRVVWTGHPRVQFLIWLGMSKRKWAAQRAARAHAAERGVETPSSGEASWHNPKLQMCVCVCV